MGGRLGGGWLHESQKGRPGAQCPRLRRAAVFSSLRVDSSTAGGHWDIADGSRRCRLARSLRRAGRAPSPKPSQLNLQQEQEQVPHVRESPMKSMRLPLRLPGEGGGDSRRPPAPTQMLCSQATPKCASVSLVTVNVCYPARTGGRGGQSAADAVRPTDNVGQSTSMRPRPAARLVTNRLV